GGVPANYIAKWDGSAWSALGSGMNSSVTALAVSGTNLYAGTGEPVNNIAKWDGSAWSVLSGIIGVYNPGIYALAVSGTDLYAGGGFTNAGGVTANYLAKWDGSAWSPLGSGMSGGANSSYVYALAADGEGHLFVGGDFSMAGTNVSPYLAQANLPSVPAILMPPQTQTAEAGATVHFAVEATGEPAPAYRWCQNGTNMLSCANNELVLTNIPYARSGTYTVVVTDVFGAVTSAPVMLNVIAPVPRRRVPGVNLTGQAGNFLGLDYRDNLGPTANWQTMATMTLSNASQYYFDLSPLPTQRFYRAWQTGTPAVVPSLDLHMVPAITLAGNVGDSLRLDYINQFGPIDAWVTLGTVTLTNSSQLYFDVSEPGQPPRLYRIVQAP
ncbi:MAG: immunoglobulin domain-containing protein, partial [Verrucomicrobiota bacterium]